MLTAEQRFLKLQLEELHLSKRWEQLFLELLPHRRMIILYPLQKQQIANIANANRDEVFLLGRNVLNPLVTLDLLEQCSIDLTMA